MFFQALVYFVTNRHLLSDTFDFVFLKVLTLLSRLMTPASAKASHPSRLLLVAMGCCIKMAGGAAHAVAV